MSAARLRTVSSVPAQIEEPPTDQVGTNQHHRAYQQQNNPIHDSSHPSAWSSGPSTTRRFPARGKVSLDDSWRGQDVRVLELLLTFLRRPEPVLEPRPPGHCNARSLAGLAWSTGESGGGSPSVPPGDQQSLELLAVADRASASARVWIGPCRRMKAGIQVPTSHTARWAGACALSPSGKGNDREFL